MNGQGSSVDKHEQSGWEELKREKDEDRSASSLTAAALDEKSPAGILPGFGVD